MAHPGNRLNKLSAVRHQTKVFEVLVEDQDGRPAKLGGAEMYVTIKASAVDETPLVQKTVGDGIEIPDPSKNKAVVTLSTDDTGALEPGGYVYDAWVVFPGTPPVRQPVVESAEFEVRRGVTTFA